MIQPRLNRLMVPPWRSFRLTVRAKELSNSFSKREDEVDCGITPELQHRLERWRGAPGLLTAAELVETAIVDGQDEEAVPAARSLLSSSSRATPSVQTQAAFVLKRAGFGREIPEHIVLGPAPTRSLLRGRTRLYPQGALGWVELALSYTIANDLHRAKRAILVALQLAPNNRHVLRAASRFFLHQNDPMRAYDTIAKNDATKFDPWLIASELALAELIDQDPRFYKLGVGMLDQQMLPRQITELAGSLATKELIEGGKKKARRFFKASMADPNANALAQAEWATPNFGNDLFSLQTLNAVDEAHEARANYYFRDGHYSEVYLECDAWLESEPYSIRPYELSATTANLLEEHAKADEVTVAGLKVRPHAQRLLNSRAYALAGLGRLEEAEAVLARIASDSPIWALLVAEANRGLIAFRRGLPLEGKARYQNAIDGFQREGFGLMALSAKTYLSREAVRFGLPEAESMIEELRSSVKNSHVNSIKRAFKAAEDFLAARKLMGAKIGQQGQVASPSSQ
jgi:Tfp pilus assembly protein PilF